VDLAEDEADKKYQAEVEAARKAQGQIQAEWQKGVDQMAQSLTDALMDGGRNIAGYLRDMFRTLVLRPILAPVMGSVAGAISGPAAAMGGGGAGGMGGLLDIGGALGGLGAFGGAAGAGIGATLGGAALGDVLAGAGAMIGQGTLAGIAGGAGLALGAVAPYAAAAYGLYLLGKKLFGKKLTDTGIEGTFSASGFSGQNFAQYKRIIGSDPRNTSPLDPQIDAALDAGANAAAATVKEYVKVLGLPVQAIEGFTKKITLSLKGKSAEEVQQAIAQAVDDFGREMAGRFGSVLGKVAKAGEDAFDTLQRLAGLQMFTDELATLGGVFGKITKLGFDARESLIELAGGMQSLSGQALSFVQNYYSRDEIAGVKARDISGVLADAGITRDFSNTAEFRAYLESLDLNTEIGRKQFAALLGVAPDFAGVAAYMAEAGTPDTLRGTSALAPSTGLLAGQNTAMDQLAATNGITLTLNSTNDILWKILGALVGKDLNAPNLNFSFTTPAAEVNGGTASAWVWDPLYERN
jgi:hypothetical protein